MNNSKLLAALLLALPLAATAQTKPATTASKPTISSPVPVVLAPTGTSGTQQQTEVIEDLDPATGKVIRRTTRTINVPVGTTAPSIKGPSTIFSDAPGVAASDAQVSAFMRRKTTVATLTAPNLVTAYQLFIERVRTDRPSWRPTDWATAAAVMSSLNGRYDALRTVLSLEDKLTIRSQQGEFQALRTARQISNQVSDKL